MDRRNRSVASERWQAWAEEWSFPAGFIGTLLIYVGLARLAPMDDPWSWVERLSWLFTIVGVPIAVFVGLRQLRQLRDEQIRTRLEIERLGKRAQVRNGFVSPVAPGRLLQRIKLYPLWLEGPDTLSDPQNFTVRTINDGTGTAYKIMLKFTIPSRVSICSATNYVPNLRNILRGYEEPTVVKSEVPEMNPGDGIDHNFSVQVLPGTSTIRLRYAIAMQDERAVSGVLDVELDQTATRWIRQ